MSLKKKLISSDIQDAVTDESNEKMWFQGTLTSRSDRDEFKQNFI